MTALARDIGMPDCDEPESGVWRPTYLGLGPSTESPRLFLCLFFSPQL